MADESRRAADSARPREAPDGEPFAQAGRPVAAALVVAAVALVTIALLLFEVTR
jgi:hypothetical protein